MLPPWQPWFPYGTAEIVMGRWNGKIISTLWCYTLRSLVQVLDLTRNTAMQLTWAINDILLTQWYQITITCKGPCSLQSTHSTEGVAGSTLTLYIYNRIINNFSTVWVWVTLLVPSNYQLAIPGSSHWKLHPWSSSQQTQGSCLGRKKAGMS